MPETTFLRFRDANGVTADGNLEPLVEIGLAIPVPVMIPNPATKVLEPGETAEQTYIYPHATLAPENPARLPKSARIVPGTRLVEVADARIATALLLTGNWEEVAQPSRAEVLSEAKALTDARVEAGTHSEPDDRDAIGQASPPASTSTTTEKTEE